MLRVCVQGKPKENHRTFEGVPKSLVQNETNGKQHILPPPPPPPNPPRPPAPKKSRPAHGNGQRRTRTRTRSDLFAPASALGGRDPAPPSNWRGDRFFAQRPPAMTTANVLSFRGKVLWMVAKSAFRTSLKLRATICWDLQGHHHARAS